MQRLYWLVVRSIYGQEHAKMALAMALFGGREKKFEKHRIRGDINVLMVSRICIPP